MGKDDLIGLLGCYDGDEVMSTFAFSSRFEQSMGGVWAFGWTPVSPSSRPAFVASAWCWALTVRFDGGVRIYLTVNLEV